MKRGWALLVFVAVFAFSGVANAGLTQIGTATYGGQSYNLIYEDNNNGQSLVWLDYVRGKFSWSTQNSWATGLGGNLTNVILNPGYSTTIGYWSTGWRLPTTIDGPSGLPYSGYNITTSEMGHLYYVSLGNKGYVAPDGTYPQPGFGLQNSDPFNNLLGSNVNDFYWSDTARTGTGSRWRFNFYNGAQDFYPASYSFRALAVHSGNGVQISAPVPIPAAVWLFGTGLLALFGVRRKIRKKDVLYDLPMKGRLQRWVCLF